MAGDYSAESFSYDDLGNRLNDQLGNYTYDAKSQRLTQDYKNTYTYDNNGNLTGITELGMTGNFKNLTYTSENQLKQLEIFQANTLVKRITYHYDALGRRYRKQIEDLSVPSNSFERKYVYDGEEILAEYDETDTVLGVYTQSTLRTDDTLAVDVKDIKLANNLGTYYFNKDALGSVIDITDSSGNLIQHYAYSSFGKLLKIVDNNEVDITASPIVKTSYGFTNREYDSESGLMYYRARYYMPEIGRFLSEDPDAGSMSNPVTFNSKYVYVHNNPQNLIDPSGEAANPLFSLKIGSFNLSFSSDDVARAATIAAIIIFTPAIAASAAWAVGVTGATGMTAYVVGALTGAVVGGAIGYVAGGAGSVAAGGDWERGAKIGLRIGAVSGFFIGGAAGYRAGNPSFSGSRGPASATCERSPSMYDSPLNGVFGLGNTTNAPEGDGMLTNFFLNNDGFRRAFFPTPVDERIEFENEQERRARKNEYRSCLK